MTDVNSLGRKCSLHLIDNYSKLGEQEWDSILMFLLSHQSLFTIKYTPSPFLLPESSVCQISIKKEKESPG